MSGRGILVFVGKSVAFALISGLIWAAAGLVTASINRMSANTRRRERESVGMENFII